MSCLDDSATDGDRQMALPYAGRAEEQDVFGLRNEASGAQLTAEALIDGGLEAKVVFIKFLYDRKVLRCSSTRACVISAVTKPRRRCRARRR